MWVEGEPNGLSEVGEEDSEEDRDDGSDGRDEVVGVLSADECVMVADRSRALVLEMNCPLRFRG